MEALVGIECHLHIIQRITEEAHERLQGVCGFVRGVGVVA